MGPPAKKPKFMGLAPVENVNAPSYFLADDQYGVVRAQLRDRNGKNSLAHLCRRFLMVLLCNPVSNGSEKLRLCGLVLIIS